MMAVDVQDKNFFALIRQLMRRDRYIIKKTETAAFSARAWWPGGRTMAKSFC